MQQEQGMNQKIKYFINRMHDRLTLIGIFLGCAFWVIESIMHVYVFHRISFIESVFSPEPHEAWMRLIIVGMFISFGIYAQLLMNARKQAQAALTASPTRNSPRFLRHRPMACVSSTANLIC